MQKHFNNIICFEKWLLKIYLSHKVKSVILRSGKRSIHTGLHSYCSLALPRNKFLKKVSVLFLTWFPDRFCSYLKSIKCYTITQVILAFWLVLAYDLLEDRPAHDWRHHFRVFASAVLKWRKVLRIRIIFYVIGQKIKYKKVLPRH